jgi:DNA invertase Pin-like site-specific DNA recombinase
MSQDTRIGYIRVSSIDQNANRQLDGIELDKVFTDKASGKDTNRPALKAMLEYVREGDVIVVHSMDRLARNLEDLRKIVRDLTGRGVKIQFIKENIIFSGDDNPMSVLLLSMMGAFAEFERELILERQREGIRIAVQNGKYANVGRKAALSDEDAERLRRRVAAGEDKAKLAREYGISRQSVYRYLSEDKDKAANE